MEDNNIQQKESIKLMKMSKGYQWEIKLLDFEKDKDVIKRLENIDKELREKYGENDIQQKIKELIQKKKENYENSDCGCMDWNLFIKEIDKIFNNSKQKEGDKKE